MNTTTPISDEQAALWNGTAGHAWVDAQAILDQMFKPFEDLLADAVREQSVENVLDVGCGTGSTTFAAARHSDCTSIDISEPMIALARKRAKAENTRAKFICADAQTYNFDVASFDMITSRFGVMFFGDSVDAFANLRRATRKDGKLQFLAWRSPAENPFMTTAERAAAPLLPNLPARKPNAPGQFAFADQDRVHSILRESGWSNIQIDPSDAVSTFSASELQFYLTRLGPLGLILNGADEKTRDQITETVLAAFNPFVHGAKVKFDAACWMVTARARDTFNK